MSVLNVRQATCCCLAVYCARACFGMPLHLARHGSSCQSVQQSYHSGLAVLHAPSSCKVQGKGEPQDERRTVAYFTTPRKSAVIQVRTDSALSGYCTNYAISQNGRQPCMKKPASLSSLTTHDCGTSSVMSSNRFSRNVFTYVSQQPASVALLKLQGPAKKYPALTSGEIVKKEGNAYEKKKGDPVWQQVAYKRDGAAAASNETPFVPTVKAAA
jgi:hypothetical protein